MNNNDLDCGYRVIDGKKFVSEKDHLKTQLDRDKWKADQAAQREMKYLARKQRDELAEKLPKIKADAVREFMRVLGSECVSDMTYINKWASTYADKLERGDV